MKTLIITVSAIIAALCFVAMLIHLATGTTPAPLHLILFAFAVATLVIASAAKPVAELRTDGTVTPRRVKKVMPTFASFNAEMPRHEPHARPQTPPRR